METRPDPNPFASTRAVLASIVRSLIAELDREGRSAMRIACTRVEGRAQIALADKLRKQAEKVGL